MFDWNQTLHNDFLTVGRQFENLWFANAQRSHFAIKNSMCKVAMRSFFVFLKTKKHLWRARVIASHARCAKFVYHNTIESFLRAFFQKSENLYLTNFPINQNLKLNSNAS